MIDPIDFESPALLDLLSPALRKLVLDAASVAKFRDGQLIHSRGDRNIGLTIVKSGAVNIGNVGIDGSFLTTSIMGPGQSFGEFTLFAELPRTHDASALGPAEIYQIGSSKVHALFNCEPDFARALLATALRRSHALLELMDDMRRLSTPVRVAKLLLSMSKTAAAPDSLQCKQTELAFVLGLSRVSLGKAIKRLESEGLVSQGYGRIVLPDIPRLRDWVFSQGQTMPLE